MSSQIRSRSRAAFVEDVDEDTGSVLQGTAKYATSQPASPVKEQSNIGRSRKSENTRRGRSPTRDDDAQLRLKTRPPAGKPSRGPPLQVRPPHNRHRGSAPNVVHSATPGGPRRHDEAEFYGVPSSAHPDGRPPPPQRQRAQTSGMPRPPSFHAGEHPRGGPPPPFPRFHGGPPPPGGPPGPLGPPLGPPPGPPGMNIPTSFPPPSWYQGGGPPPSRGLPPQLHAPPPRTPLEGPPNGYPFPPTQPYGHPPPGGMDRRARPHSSIGHRQQQPSYDFAAAFGHDDVDGGPPPLPPAPQTVARRPSVSQQQQQRRRESRQSMPPPVSHPQQMRPQSARPANALMFRPPPQDVAPMRRKVNFDQTSDDEEDSEVEYLGQDAADEYNIPETRFLPAPPTARSVVPRSQGRRMSVDRSASYAHTPGRTEVASTRRYSSQYGTSFNSSVQEDSDEFSEDDLNEKIKGMQLYTGGAPAAPPPPRQRLTQGALRHVSQRGGGGSSRSTGSSDSFDESEMPSHTTRTSHSNGDENGGGGVKIRGAKRINIGGVDVELGGAEIEISASRNEHRGSFREETGTVYRGEDRRPQYEHRPPRPPMPQRTSSRTESFSRSRTAHPQLTSGYPPPPSQYGPPYQSQSPADYASPGPGAYPSPAGAYPELEWQPQQQPAQQWSHYGERAYYR